MSAAQPTSTARFTCRACRETFTTRDEMKAHFGTDLHRVNVGLRVEGQAPITKDQVEDPNKKTEKAPAAPAPAEATPAPQPAEPEVIDMDSVSEGACLFCRQICDDLEANITHMKMAHGFTLPAASRLTDKLGMVRYLQYKVWSGLCLWCTSNGRHFRGLEGVQSHMRSTGHCAVLWLGEEDEYADFYDAEFMSNLERVGSEEGVGGQLVLADGRKVLNREAVVHKHRPYFTKFKTEGDDEEGTQRKLIMAAKAAHTTPGTLMKREELRQQQKEIYLVHERPALRERQDYLIAQAISASKLFKTMGRIGDN